MTPSGILTLTTDFGLEDPFVGVLHGVILGRCPGAKIVDLTHGVAPQAVDQAAFLLEKSFRWFPEGSVHVAVVDPGVGTDRAALVVRAAGHVFVAPDNGLLGRLAQEPGASVHAIDVERLGLPLPSRTFHGRDVFAPVAAEIVAGRLRPAEVGPAAAALSLQASGVRFEGERVIGSVICVDHFGNLITNIPAAELRRFERPSVELAGRALAAGGTYQDVPAGEPIALVSSFDTLEIAIRDGDAGEFFGAKRGAEVVLGPEQPKQGHS